MSFLFIGKATTQAQKYYDHALNSLDQLDGLVEAYQNTLNKGAFTSLEHLQSDLQRQGGKITMILMRTKNKTLIQEAQQIEDLINGQLKVYTKYITEAYTSNNQRALQKGIVGAGQVTEIIERIANDCLRREIQVIRRNL